MNYPKIFFKKGFDKRLRKGSPWIFSNEIQIDSESKTIPIGSVVLLCSSAEQGSKPLVLGYFNPHSLICFRVLSFDIHEEINIDFFEKKIRRALELREKFFDRPYYRLVHAESDGLPGLIIDRYNDIFSVQLNTAGMDNQSNVITQTLQKVFHVKHLIFKNDSPFRSLDGLQIYTEESIGALTNETIVIENDIEFFCDLRDGQKTGWFYDQRDNRKLVAQFAKGAKILDAYSYMGGFGINCAVAGATHVTCLDRSEKALEYASKTAEKLKIDKDKISFVKENVFDFFENYNNELFDIIILDPPAFIKSKKDIHVGTKGYLKLLKNALPFVKNGGFLFFASCSHHLTLELFYQTISESLLLSKKNGRILRVTGAGMDHPAHPHLPESQYLKGALVEINDL